MPRVSTVLDAARGDAQDTGLLDHREQCPLGPTAGFEQRGEVAAVTDARDGQADGAHAGVPAPLPVAVALGGPVLGIAHPVGDPGELGHLSFHDCLGEHLYALAQEVGVALGPGLAHRLEQAHPVIGHRGSPSSWVPKSNDVRMTRWPLLFLATPLLHQL